VGVLDLQARADGVVAEDGSRKSRELEDRAHPGALPVHVDAAGNLSDIERPDGRLDRVEDALVGYERIPVRDDRQDRSGVLPDDGETVGDRLGGLETVTDEAEGLKGNREVGWMAAGDGLVDS